MRFILPIALAVALISSAKASDYAIACGGLSLCGAWTTARRDRQAIGFEESVAGFLSGFEDLAASVLCWRWPPCAPLTPGPLGRGLTTIVKLILSKGSSKLPKL